MRTYEVARRTTGGCSEQEIEKVLTDSSDNTEESGSEQEKEMAKKSRRGKRKHLQSSETAKKNHSDSQNDTESPNSGGPTQAPIINGNQPPTSSNATIAQLQKENGTLLGLLNQKNAEIQILTNMLTQNKAQQVVDDKEKSELRKLLAQNLTFVSGLTETMNNVTQDCTQTMTSIQNHL